MAMTLATFNDVLKEVYQEGLISNALYRDNPFLNYIDDSRTELEKLIDWLDNTVETVCYEGRL